MERLASELSQVRLFIYRFYRLEESTRSLDLAFASAYCENMPIENMLILFGIPQISTQDWI